ncbi:MAG: diguanylate cyclase [Lysobacter sp.]|nr:diguanylate cyclase [Lysobacter sp.]
MTAHGASRYGDLLAEADSIRSSNPKRFLEIIVVLEKRKSEATKIESQKLRYLQAFSTIYQDRFADGFKQSTRLYKQVSDVDLKFRTGSLIANLTAISRDFSTGLPYVHSNLEMRDKVKDKKIRQDGIGTAAMFYNQMGQYSLGLKYADEVLGGSPAPRVKCFASSVKLEAQQVLGKLDGSSDSFDSALADCLKLPELMAASTLRATRARELAKLGEIEKAVALLEQDALPDVLATRYPRLIAEIRSLLGELKLKKGDLTEAQKQSEETIALGDAIKSTQALVTAYGTLYQIAERRGQTEQALALYKQYAQAEKAYLGDVKAREVAYEMFHEQTQQQSQQLALERESTQKARLVMVFLMLLLAGIIFWVIQIKRHQGQLQRLAQTDTLTGLGNRHFFTQKSERALIDAARAGQPAALVMFDLDHFKAINDTYGHGAGDWVLKQVGKTCSSHCRKVDYLGRIGGEEFAVLLHGLDLATAARLAEDCRSQLAQIDTRECGYSFVVTASFGVSSTAQSGYDLSRLLSHADQMLYRAKNEGRNRVCAYTAETAADYKSPKRTPTLSVVGGG